MPTATLSKNAKQGNTRQDLGLVTVKGHILTPGDIAASRAVSLGTLMQDTTLADSNPITLANAPGSDRLPDGTPGESDMAYIRKLAKNGDALDPAKLYALSVAPSTQRIDSFFTQMDETSLRNYAAAAMFGIPFMNSHRTGGYSQPAQLPIGLSYWGGVEPDPSMPEDSGLKRFVSALYMRRGSTSNDGGVSTDSLIADIDAGILRDISIGFRFFEGTPERNFEDKTWLKCSICGRDALDVDWWEPDPETECIHWPGETYTHDGGTRKELCYLIVMEARIGEFSGVYSGATPGAVTLRAEQAAASGNLTRSTIRNLEQMYNVRLLGASQHGVPDLAAIASKKGKEEMATRKNSGNGKPQEQQPDAVAQAVRQARQEQFMTQVKAVTDARELDENELAVIKQAIDECAAGDVDAASATLATLMSGVTPADDAETEDEEIEAGTELTDAETETDIERPENEIGDVDGDGEQSTEPETQLAQPAPTIIRQTSGISISQLELTASERQQFREMKKELAALRKQVRELEPLAEIGLTYRERMIDATVAESVRAQMGSAETVREMLSMHPVSGIENLYWQYKALGDARLSRLDEMGVPLLVGGRQTEPLDPNAQHGVIANRRGSLSVVQPSVDPNLYKTGTAARRR